MDEGIKAAFSGMPSVAMADALAELPEQIEEILLRAMARIREAEAMQRARAGKI